MHPHLSESWGLEWHAILLVAGYMVAFLLARWRVRHAGLEGRHLDNLAMLLLPVIVLGATMLYALSHAYEMQDLGSALLTWRSSGLAFYGALGVAGMVGIGYCVLFRIPVFAFGDAVAPAIPLGHAILRIGCYLAGCCWGDVCTSPNALLTTEGRAMAAQIQTVPALSGSCLPWAVRFPEGSHAFHQHVDAGLLTSSATHSLPVHPVQLYECALLLILGLYLWMRPTAEDASGKTIRDYLLLYAGVRFTVEFFRADNHAVFGMLTNPQIQSVLLALLSFLAYVCLRPRGRRAVAARAGLTRTTTRPTRLA